MSMTTPLFPCWRARLAPMTSRLARTVQTVRTYTFCQLETRLGPYLPTSLFPKTRAKANSRDRIYTRTRTFWSMLWQGLNPKTSCREVVRQLQALFALQGQNPDIDPYGPLVAVMTGGARYMGVMPFQGVQMTGGPCPRALPWAEVWLRRWRAADHCVT